ncbi:hypothetical protein N657DRAFT_644958 [Parathielavia appendiculata]|uniref:Uncharacterized protein n=1 Tax=Parathielavia appendiculata TaxID=2587402 RepID=A0AAN6U419_9PEZI|nr:hypothetical protein N657DRAFT_644958 [Parathielavia appendiculata]
MIGICVAPLLTLTTIPGHLHLDSRPRSGFRAGQPDEKARRHRPNGGLACLEVLTVVICSVLPEMVFLAVDGLGRSGGYCPYNRHVNEECEAELRLWREVGSYVTLSMTLPLALV